MVLFFCLIRKIYIKWPFIKFLLCVCCVSEAWLRKAGLCHITLLNPQKQSVETLQYSAFCFHFPSDTLVPVVESLLCVEGRSISPLT